jgi:Ca2+-binding RTX toxin-like protein
VKGEVDTLTVSLVAGTTYTLEMLGVSSLGTAGSLGDTLIRLVGPSGSLLTSDDDSGPGFDSSLTFTASATGNYTVQLTAVGALTGGYVVQGAVVGGAAMLGPNTYVINNATTVILEGEGIGTDVVKASVSYALAAGSQIEMLRTTNDKGKGSIDLIGNEFAQSIVGNSGANKIDGKAGADTLTGGGGKDTFLLTSALGPNNVDHITDFNVRDDTIALSGSVFTGLSAGALAAGAFALGSNALQSDDRILYDRASGHLFFDPDGSGAVYSPIIFATVSAGLNLTAADFIVGL